MALKPLAVALRDGDNICAVIKGTAVTQDGHTNGITVPNGEAAEAHRAISGRHTTGKVVLTT